LVVDVVYVHVTDNASLVNDKEGTLRETFLTQDTIVLGHLAVWEKVAQERIGNASQAVGPCLEARDTVYADAQDLGLHPLEPVE
jgi:hypothetical protein